jgi:hypothetical protein
MSGRITEPSRSRFLQTISFATNLPVAVQAIADLRAAVDWERAVL